jgi:hypothetical protein
MEKTRAAKIVVDPAHASGWVTAEVRIARTLLVVAFIFVTLTAHGVARGTERLAKESSPGGEARAPRLDVRMSGSFALAPAVLRSTVFVEQSPDNRILRVSVDGENYYSSSDIALEGANAPRSHQMQWYGLPAGEYQVSMELFGTAGSRAVLVRRFSVVGQ